MTTKKPEWYSKDAPNREKELRNNGLTAEEALEALKRGEELFDFNGARWGSGYSATLEDLREFEPFWIAKK